MRNILNLNRFFGGGGKLSLRGFVLKSFRSAILIFIALFVLSIVGSFYTYFKINAGDFGKTDHVVNVSSKPIDKVRLFKVINYFEQKKVKASESAERTFIDPSL